MKNVKYQVDKYHADSIKIYQTFVTNAFLV